MTTLNFHGLLNSSGTHAILSRNDEIKQADGINKWKRDFEDNEDSVHGVLRKNIKTAKEKGFLVEGLDIRVENLTYTSKVLRYRIRSIPTVILHYLNIFGRVKDLLCPNEMRKRIILNNINLTFKKRSMTLVLGSPGSGQVSHLLRYHRF